MLKKNTKSVNWDIYFQACLSIRGGGGGVGVVGGQHVLYGVSGSALLLNEENMC